MVPVGLRDRVLVDRHRGRGLDLHHPAGRATEAAMTYWPASEEIDDLRAEIARLRAENELLFDHIMKTEQRAVIGQLRAELKRLQAEAREAHAIIDALSGQIKQLHDDNARLSEQAKG
jgi:cell division protein FtsB